MAAEFNEIEKKANEQKGPTASDDKKETMPTLCKPAFAEWVARKSGAVHCSKAFDVSTARTQQSHARLCMNRGADWKPRIPWHYAYLAPEALSKYKFCQTLQWNMWCYLRRVRIQVIYEVSAVCQRSMPPPLAGMPPHGLTTANLLFLDLMKEIEDGPDGHILKKITPSAKCLPVTKPTYGSSSTSDKYWPKNSTWDKSWNKKQNHW